MLLCGAGIGTGLGFGAVGLCCFRLCARDLGLLGGAAGLFLGCGLGDCLSLGVRICLSFRICLGFRLGFSLRFFGLLCGEARGLGLFKGGLRMSLRTGLLSGQRGGGVSFRARAGLFCRQLFGAWARRRLNLLFYAAVLDDGVQPLFKLGGGFEQLAFELLEERHGASGH